MQDIWRSFLLWLRRTNGVSWQKLQRVKATIMAWQVKLRRGETNYGVSGQQLRRVGARITACQDNNYRLPMAERVGRGTPCLS